MSVSAVTCWDVETLVACHLLFDCRLEADNRVAEALQSFQSGCLENVRQIANRCLCTCSYS